MKKEKENLVTTVTHSRKGSIVNLKNISGDVKVLGQRPSGHKSKGSDTVEIEVTGTAKTHDVLQIKGTKGRVDIIGQEILTPHCDLRIYVPSGISLWIENVSGIITISETVETLAIMNRCPCQVFTETLHSAMFHVGKDVDIKIKHLVGYCDIAASSNAQIEVRDAALSVLSVVADGNAKIDLYGTARFAKTDLSRRSRLHINMVDCIESHKDPTAQLDVSWTNHRMNEDEHRDLSTKASAEIASFAKRIRTFNVAMPATGTI